MKRKKKIPPLKIIILTQRQVMNRCKKYAAAMGLTFDEAAKMDSCERNATLNGTHFSMFHGMLDSEPKDA